MIRDIYFIRSICSFCIIENGICEIKMCRLEIEEEKEMNETERRRKQLLEETRRKYGDTKTPPAIHPRYEAIYSELYEEKSTRNDGFFLRTMIAVLLFALFVVMDYSEEKVATVDSKWVVEKIRERKW